MSTKKFRWMGVLSGSVVLGAGIAACGEAGPGAARGQEADSGARPLPRTAPPSELQDAGGWPAPDTEHRLDATLHGDDEDGGGLDDGGDLAADGGDGGVTPRCDPSTEDEPDDGFADTNCDGIDGDAKRAIFVANEGSDGAVGTRGAPVATLSRALELAALESKDIYVCNGKYPEAVRIEAPVRLYGGYACTREWKRVPDRPLVEPLAGAALTVTDVEGPVVLDRLRLRAASVTEPGASSIGAVIRRSGSVLLSRLQLEAGDAGDGLDGAPVPDPKWTASAPAADAADVRDAATCNAIDWCRSVVPGRSDPGCWSTFAGAAGIPLTCPDGLVVLGGPGGSGGNCGVNAGATRGRQGLPAEPILLPVRPPLFTSIAPEALPKARNGRAGRSSERPFGTIQDGWYSPAADVEDGTAGAAGFSGKGGDGSPSSTNSALSMSYVVGGGGGQGGYGGCSGAAGKAGSSGGASVGLLVVTSGVTLAHTRVLTGRGGNGGNPSGGVKGQPGGPGGKGGSSGGMVRPPPGQDGQGGQDGGDGGIGGAGAGGPSVGIVFTQLAPVVTDTAFVLGEPGLGGIGAVAAADGLLAEIHDASSQYGVQP